MKKFEGVTDEKLALLYVKGNNSAFDELLERTQTKLFTYIMFVVHDHDLADDIFQETFVKSSPSCRTDNIPTQVSSNSGLHVSPTTVLWTGTAYNKASTSWNQTEKMIWRI